MINVISWMMMMIITIIIIIMCHSSICYFRHQICLFVYLVLPCCCCCFFLELGFCFNVSCLRLLHTNECWTYTEPLSLNLVCNWQNVLYILFCHFFLASIICSSNCSCFTSLFSLLIDAYITADNDDNDNKIVCLMCNEYMLFPYSIVKEEKINKFH